MKIRPLADLLDKAAGSNDHGNSLRLQQMKLHSPELTPSAQVLKAIEKHHQSYIQFSLAQSHIIADAFRARPPSPDELNYFQNLALISIAEQENMEKMQEGNFDQFITDYRSRTSSQICCDE